MRFKLALFIGLLSACSMLPFPGMGGGNSQTKTNHSETSSSSTKEELKVNGRRVALDDEGGGGGDDDEERPRSKKKTKKDDDDDDFGKTCHKNKECANDACFTGNGDLGYCTKMCSSWSECPSHWECKKAGNAPQRICMQDD